MPVNLLIAGIDPPFHRPAIHMRAQPQRGVPGFALAQAVSIEAFAIRIKFKAILGFELPQTVQPLAGDGQLFRCARLHLRL